MRAVLRISDLLHRVNAISLPRSADHRRFPPVAEHLGPGCHPHCAQGLLLYMMLKLYSVWTVAALAASFCCCAAISDCTIACVSAAEVSGDGDGDETSADDDAELQSYAYPGPCEG